MHLTSSTVHFPKEESDYVHVFKTTVSVNICRATCTIGRSIRLSTCLSAACLCALKYAIQSKM